MQSSAPGTVRHLHPYRGCTGGTCTQCADVPRVPVSGGTPAHAKESATYSVCHCNCVPGEMRVPFCVPLQMSSAHAKRSSGTTPSQCKAACDDDPPLFGGQAA